MKFSAETAQTLDSLVTKAADNIPGTTVVVVSKDGSELFVKSAGKRGVASSESMTTDNIFWIASCTKMLTGLSCMQLVEKGILKLDDAEHLEKLLPEFKKTQVLGKDGKLSPLKNKITLRMLLTHTAGFGYAFFNEELRDFGYPSGIDEFSGDFFDIDQPVTFQPGENWQYGTNIDWAGLALERATGKTLNDYMQENLFQPLGLKNINMFPTEDMKKKLAFMHQRAPDGKLSARDHLLRRAITASTPEEKKAIFNSGGAGAFAKPSEYCRIISTLLNDGTCPVTGAKLLEKATVDEMFTNQITKFPDFARQGIPASKPDLTNPLPELYPQEGNPPQGWGLTFMVNGGPTGRADSTVWWAGLANLFWWADRENGVGGMVCSQILPFGDPNVMGLWGQVEATVYQGLKAASSS